MNETDRASFLYASIGDTQATIRAVDVKAQVLLALIVVPLTQVEAATTAYKELVAKVSTVPLYVVTCAGGVLVIAWLSSLLLLVRSLWAVHNPMDQIRFEQRKPKGTFYPGAVFRFTCRGAALGRCGNAPVALDAHASLLPNTKDELEDELVFEQLKLGYIVSRKIACYRGASIMAIIWALASVVVWAIHVGSK